ncbi:MAG TPA: TetR family transcriptional regulator [Ktedonobacterales bacterium]|nr:TetR family transcriptional regulator [Ktedonobacterales bacterium]
MPRPKQADPLARRQILAAALEVFSRQGYGGTTLDDITAAANLSKGAIYWYFESKADLFATMLGERASIYSEILEDAARGANSPLEALRLMWLRWMEALETDRGYQSYVRLAHLRVEVADEPREGMDARRNEERRTQATITERILAAIAARELPVRLDVEAAALSFVGVGNGLVRAWLLVPETFSPRAVAPRIWNLLLAGWRYVEE